MPKAVFTTEDGTKISIEGTPEEVRDLLTRLRPTGKQIKAGKGRNASRNSKKTGPSMPDSIIELKVEGFFNKPKGLADIKEKLASLGRIYPVTSISGTVLSLVKRRELGRVKEKGRWCYVAR